MKLVSLNMEHDKHLERVVPFLQREEPDVVCLQEVLEGDLSRLGVALGAQWHFAPMTRFTHEGHPRHGEVQGVAVFSRVPVLGHEVRYYFGGEGSVPDHCEDERDSVWQALVMVEVELSGKRVRIGTTHFMKSYHGAPDDYQRRRLPALLSVLEQYDSFVVCGDFNIPRGTELYYSFASHYVDRVPQHYASSIDPNLHRVPGLRYMIDYFWSTPDMSAEEVSMVCGVSDHCALVGILTPTNTEAVVRTSEHDYAILSA